jgi:AraC-like DNA-binding protein
MSDFIRIDTISQVHDFLGLDKPKHPLVTVIRRFDQLNEVDFGEYRYVFNLYQLSFKSGMEGSLNYGRNTYDFQEGTLIFTSPGQTLQFDSEQHTPDEEAWSILFHPDLIRKSELGRNIDNYTFFSYESNEALHLSDEEKKSIAEIVGKIEKEYSQNIDRHSQKLIISNIELLLDYCVRYYDRQFYTRTNLNKDIVTRFESLLKAYYKSGLHYDMGVPSVSYCGGELNMSPNYLSDLLKKETGRNAQEHIHFFVIEKAKNELLNSDESVSQIAFGLGFEYPQHFSKVFKAKTGMSPIEYRSLN